MKSNKGIFSKLNTWLFSAVLSLAILSGLQVGGDALQHVSQPSVISSEFALSGDALRGDTHAIVVESSRYSFLISEANAGAMTDYAENKVIDFLLRGQTLTPPTTFYYALYTTCPTDSAAGTEVSGGSYARVGVTSSLANWAGTQAAASTVASSGTSGTTSNNTVVTFAAPTANWGVVACWGLLDASTAGNLWIYSTLTTSKTINSGDSAPSFAAAAATFQIDN